VQPAKGGAAGLTGAPWRGRSATRDDLTGRAGAARSSKP